MGNTARELSKRLLHLLPVQVLRDEFKSKDSAIDLIESVSGSRTTVEIKKFISQNQSYTRQNIYLFKLNKSFNRTSIKKDFPLDIEFENNQGAEFIFFCLPVVTFSVYLSNPTAKEEIKFLQPLTISINNKNLIIQYTKIESQMRFHFPLTREAKKNSEDNSEEITLQIILDYLGKNYSISANDINKGVKHLWDIDDIDCIKISNRDPDSTTTTVMDAEKTFKKRYPALYKKIILTPINSAIWKYLLQDNYLCEGFTADLTGGKISITKSAKFPNQVINVITKILTYN